MTTCSYALYVIVVYYHCPTDTNTEIKEVIFNFHVCKLKRCKLRCEVKWQEVFKLKKAFTNIGSKQGLGIFVIKLHKLNQQAYCF